MLQAKLCAVDAVFNKEGQSVNALNSFLENHPFGPFAHLSAAAIEVQRLRKKGKVKKADELKTLLQQFAASRGVSKDAFEELPALLALIHERNAFAHPYDETYLVSEIGNCNSDLSSISNVLLLLINKPPPPPEGGN
ncbi:hypothetical protein HXX76_004105 [Chlamydomonas incerta]|uniref:Uncharacterized protein n=1 Tax=Chlamydomonas incerta TaxID=51695 RepID=A0A835T6T6_CHLIN|nr:hypothetical protein HXX76_004105 [Chlamydomonas incerta]|eukprot:KAG2439987.1 hypothetical protein HXX76_004105 [Chlamydomonas incerta]